jgi:hypothetical protein
MSTQSKVREGQDDEQAAAVWWLYPLRLERKRGSADWSAVNMEEMRQ